jgi:trimeric autotransporter adhesin
MIRAWLATVGLSLALAPTFGQNRIGVGPGYANLRGGVYGEVNSFAVFSVNGVPNGNVKFKIDRFFTANTPNPLIVSPPSGTTPQQVIVGLNPNVTRTMGPGSFEIGISFTTVDQTPPSNDAVVVTVTLSDADPPLVRAAVNSASFQPVVSPGGMISISGTSLGPPVLSSEYDVGGLYPTAFGSTRVIMNGIAAPLLYVSPGQINAVVPYGLAGQKTAEVVVSHYGQNSAAFSVPVADTSPAIFTAGQNGSGQGAILNYVYPNYSYNSVDNPAAPGSVVVLYATGAGVWDGEVLDGSISLIASRFTAKPVSLMIGGQPATILYAGASPYQTMGLLQVNAVVPEKAGSGQQPVVLTIGQTDNAQQKVTMAIK